MPMQLSADRRAVAAQPPRDRGIPFPLGKPARNFLTLVEGQNPRRPRARAWCDATRSPHQRGDGDAVASQPLAERGGRQPLLPPHPDTRYFLRCKPSSHAWHDPSIALRRSVEYAWKFEIWN
jgi:hypothetical protein